ncbi:alpha/beta hydrolase [Fodinicola feengrottensis]|uniref:Alpha/beta hydrolase n=1 Tax=Fodinicola feengrottensis TaxID=435914 RepID=A0ABP4SB86_9ACTN
MPFVTAEDGTPIFFCDWGSAAAPPVVLVHAWALNSDMWSAQVPDLTAAGFRCVTYDRRGHGRSDRPGSGYDLDTLADDLAAVLDCLDVSDALLVGHSMGAAEIIRYLTRHGTSRAAGVVLSAPMAPFLLRTKDNPGGIEESSFESARQAMRDDIGAFVDAAPWSDYFGASLEVSPALADWTRRQIVDTPLQILLETQRAFTRADLRQELAQFTLPTLVIQGSADRSAAIELTGERAAALVPGSRLVVMNGAGHGLYASGAGRYDSELIAFARDCLPR